MAKVIIMPKLGFTQEEGSLMGWHKKVGDTVRKGEPFFDVHTDKSVVTIDAAESGTLLKIAVENEETVPVFTPIAVVGEAGEDPDAALKAHVMDVAPDAAVTADFDDEPAPAPAEQEAAPSAEGLKLTPKARKLIADEKYDMASIARIRGTGYEGGITARDIKASPLARKLAEKTGTPLETVTGTGAGGKVMKRDVERPQRRLPPPYPATTSASPGPRPIRACGRSSATACPRASSRPPTCTSRIPWIPPTSRPSAGCSTSRASRRLPCPTC